MNRIDQVFARLKTENRRALMPFVTAGDPDLATTAMLITELINRGAHLIEVGIPYSDPVADGPVISASYHRALERGLKVAHIFQTLRTPYRVYQAETPEDIAKAVADVGKQQNFPLDYLEQIPRQDYSRHCLTAAALCCLMLLAYRAVQLRSWA